MGPTAASDKPLVVVVGGGIAGLEALLALHELAAEGLALTLVAPNVEFVYKPWIVVEPFSPQPAMRLELEPLAAELGAEFVRRSLEEVRADEHVLVLDDGSELRYDVAVICAGARSRAPFSRGEVMMLGREINMDDLLRRAAERASGRRARIGFVVPPGVAWTLPIYELALMCERRIRERRLEADCVIVTPEAAPLIAFGTVASRAVAELLVVRGIEVLGGRLAHERGDGSLIAAPGDEPLEFDELIALAVLEGLAIPGLPADESGFIPIDDHARIVGTEDLYAAGDGTNFPIKQGGIGTQQADAAAEHIAARFGALREPAQFHPVLRGKLVTGEESLHLRYAVAGGGGEGEASLDYLWWPPHKVSGRYLAPWLARESVHEPEPPARTLDVEVALPREWHREPMALDPYGPLERAEGGS